MPSSSSSHTGLHGPFPGSSPFRANLDLCLLLEPSTSAPYRIEDAITRNRARTLDAGQSHIYEVELESLDKLL